MPMSMSKKLDSWESSAAASPTHRASYSANRSCPRRAILSCRLRCPITASVLPWHTRMYGCLEIDRSGSTSRLTTGSISCRRNDITSRERVRGFRSVCRFKGLPL
jgi:hypothetical protein